VSKEAIFGWETVAHSGPPSTYFTAPCSPPPGNYCEPCAKREVPSVVSSRLRAWTLTYGPGAFWCIHIYGRRNVKPAWRFVELAEACPLESISAAPASPTFFTSCEIPPPVLVRKWTRGALLMEFSGAAMSTTLLSPPLPFTAKGPREEDIAAPPYSSQSHPPPTSPERSYPIRKHRSPLVFRRACHGEILAVDFRTPCASLF